MESGPAGVLLTTLLNRITHSCSLWHEPFIEIYNCLGSIPLQRLNYGFGLTKQRPLSSVFTSPRKLDGLHGHAMNFKTAKENVFTVLLNIKQHPPLPQYRWWSLVMPLWRFYCETDPPSMFHERSPDESRHSKRHVIKKWLSCVWVVVHPVV